MPSIRDPELLEALAAYDATMPNGLRLDNIDGLRKAMLLASQKLNQQSDIRGVVSEDFFVPGSTSSPRLKMRIYRPKHLSGRLPAVLWMHGGGYMLGSVEGDEQRVKRIVRDAACVVVSVEYRLAPEHPFPAALDDCYASLMWLSLNADRLNIDPSRIAIGGASAGGGLAAALALMVRDREEIDVCFQLLIYPMLDDTNVTKQNEKTPVWSSENNLIAWKSYLANESDGESISPYAAAFRAKDLSGLPPALISVGTVDLFLDENIVYAQRLVKASVPTELHVYADGFHGFDSIATQSQVAKRFYADYIRVLSRALGTY